MKAYGKPGVLRKNFPGSNRRKWRMTRYEWEAEKRKPKKRARREAKKQINEALSKDML
jgi:hypothetical protein